MEVEKRTSKGGFFHIFDWNGKSKSRKRLFSSKSELDDGARQRNCRIDKLVEADEDTGMDMIHQAGYYPNQALSTGSSDEGCGTRVPGVVAKLMGLDSLPSSCGSQPHSPHSCAFKEKNCSETTPEFVNDDLFTDKPEGLEVFLVKPRPQKFPSKPTQRFQTEVLPPKSAKSIPTAHHKLQTPVKSRSFVPRKGAAHIMEAVTKPIDSAPQAANKTKNPSFRSSSIPLRIQDLRQRMEAAKKVPRIEKRNDSVSVRDMKVPFLGLKDAPMPKTCADSKKIRSNSLNNYEKSLSLAIQAKFNVQRRGEMTSCGTRKREGLTSDNNEICMNQKEHGNVSTNNITTRHSGLQNSAQKRSTAEMVPRVLRQNNQQQNCVSGKGKSSFGTSGSSQQVNRSLFVNGSSGPLKSINTVVVSCSPDSGNMSSATIDSEKKISSSKTRASQMKQSSNKQSHSQKKIRDVSTNRDINFLKSDVSVCESIHQEVGSRKKSLDVVSFTFTTPIKRSPSSVSQETGTSNTLPVASYCENDHTDLENSKLSAPSLNIICSDALSFLLDEKLRELACKVENHDLFNAETASSTLSGLRETVSTSVVSTVSEELQMFHPSLHINDSDSLLDIDSFHGDGQLLEAEQKQQDFVMEAHFGDRNNNKADKDLFCQRNFPISVSEPPSSSRSCISTDSQNSDNDSGISPFSPTFSQEAISCPSTENTTPVEGDAEWSESASSTWDGGGSCTAGMPSIIDNEAPMNWELQYVRDIIWNAELCEDFVVGEEACSMLKPGIFDRLEYEKGGCDWIESECSRLDRRVWFECITECLDVRCRRSRGSGCSAWGKWATLFQRRGWLVEEVYKEIVGWKSMTGQMVDGLVERDIGSWHGKWVDFGIEAFEEGVVIERDILSCLVNDLVGDLLLSQTPS